MTHPFLEKHSIGLVHTRQHLLPSMHLWTSLYIGSVPPVTSLICRALRLFAPYPLPKAEPTLLQ